MLERKRQHEALGDRTKGRQSGSLPVLQARKRETTHIQISIMGKMMGQGKTPKEEALEEKS